MRLVILPHIALCNYSYHDHVVIISILKMTNAITVCVGCLWCSNEKSYKYQTRYNIVTSFYNIQHTSLLIQLQDTLVVRQYLNHYISMSPYMCVIMCCYHRGTQCSVPSMISVLKEAQLASLLLRTAQKIVFQHFQIFTCSYQFNKNDVHNILIYTFQCKIRSPMWV